MIGNDDKDDDIIQDGDAFYIGVDFIEEKEEGDLEEDKSPMAEDNKRIQEKSAIITYQKTFQDMFLELHDIDKGFSLAKEGFTKALLENGSDSNPQAVYQYIGMITTRLQKIHTIRRMCHLMGLTGDMEDRVLDHELTLLYTTKEPYRRSTTDLSNPIAGEFSNDKK